MRAPLPRGSSTHEDDQRAARALCKFDGHAENIRFEGAPMWRSYVPQVRALLDSVRQAAPPARTSRAAAR